MGLSGHSTGANQVGALPRLPLDALFRAGRRAAMAVAVRFRTSDHVAVVASDGAAAVLVSAHQPDQGIRAGSSTTRFATTVRTENGRTHRHNP